MVSTADQTRRYRRLMPLVLLDSDGPVRTITLNAPERRNALDWPLLDELAAAVSTVRNDPDARALVVAGNGSAFCAGANLANLFGDIDRPVDQMREHLKKVVDWCRERGTILVSDECYVECEWEAEPVSILHPDVCDGAHEGLLAVHSL